MDWKFVVNNLKVCAFPFHPYHFCLCIYFQEQDKLEESMEAAIKTKSKVVSKAGPAEPRRQAAAKKPPRSKKATQEETTAEPMEVSAGSAMDTG